PEPPLEPGEVMVWDATTSPECRTLAGPDSAILELALSPDGKLLASAVGRTVTVREFATGRERLTLRDLPSPADALACSPDGRRLAGGLRGGKDGKGWGVVVWEVRSGKVVGSLAVKEHEGPVWEVGFRAGAARLWSSRAGGAIDLWDV